MNILLIGNDASRTGAPLVLLYLLQWLRANTDARCEVLLRIGGGPLQPEFERLAPVTAFDRLVTNRSPVRRLGRRLGLARVAGERFMSGLEQMYRSRGIDLIFANTVTNGGILADLAQLGCPVITYVHELDSMIRQYGETNFEHVRRQTTCFVAGSRVVAANLVRLGVPAERIDTVPGFISGEVLDRPAPDANGVRRRHGIPPDAFLALGSGPRNWRKGKDLFIQLALNVRSLGLGRDIRFLWLGGREGDDEWYQAQYDIEHAGLGAVLTQVWDVKRHVDYTAACDVFAMVSREDPFPLTNLEAAYYGKPVVCFAGAGGSPEFVEDDAGMVVPYLDVAEMAHQIVRLASDEALRRRLGECGARKVRERHELRVTGPQLYGIMKSVLGI